MIATLDTRRQWDNDFHVGQKVTFNLKFYAQAKDQVGRKQRKLSDMSVFKEMHLKALFPGSNWRILPRKTRGINQGQRKEHEPSN